MLHNIYFSYFPLKYRCFLNFCRYIIVYYEAKNGCANQCANLLRVENG